MPGLDAANFLPSAVWVCRQSYVTVGDNNRACGLSGSAEDNPGPARLSKEIAGRLGGAPHTLNDDGHFGKY